MSEPTITVYDGQRKNPTVLNKAQYDALCACGMMWEFHPDAPLSWPFTASSIQPTPAPAPTPRTEASLKSRNHLPEWFGDVVSADFARTLERELTSAQAALAAKDAEIENLMWNLAGCDTLAMGYAKPGEFSKELARPALHSVSKLRAERDQLRAEIARLTKIINNGLHVSQLPQRP